MGKTGIPDAVRATNRILSICFCYCPGNVLDKSRHCIGLDDRTLFHIVWQGGSRWGGKGGICPPWNFKIQVILPNFAPPEIKIRGFLLFI